MNTENMTQQQIPKVIHYCWFGGGKKSELLERCIASWKKYCPDYEIIEWNESNCSLDFCKYAQRAYRKKRWGFVSDAVRCKIIYEHGGVYLDTDVELKKNIDELLYYDAWFAYGTNTQINLGSGFGAVAGNRIIKCILDEYVKLSYWSPLIVCTERDEKVFRHEFKNFAANSNVVPQISDNMIILDNYWSYMNHYYTATYSAPWRALLKKYKITEALLCQLRKLRNFYRIRILHER